MACGELQLTAMSRSSADNRRSTSPTPWLYTRTGGRPCIKSAYRHGIPRDPSRPCAKSAPTSVLMKWKPWVSITRNRNSSLPNRTLTRPGRQPAPYSMKNTAFPVTRTAGRLRVAPHPGGQWASYLKSAGGPGSVTGEHLVPPLMEKAVR